MTKAELVQRVSAETGVAPDVVERGVGTALAVITRALANDDSVVLPRFGKFWAAAPGAGGGSSNPCTGQTNQRAGRRPRFRAATGFKRRVNEALSMSGAKAAPDRSRAVVLRRKLATTDGLPRSYTLMRPVNSPEAAAALVVVNKEATSSRSLTYRPEGV